MTTQNQTYATRNIEHNRKVSILGRERVWYPIFPSHQNFGNGYQDTRKTSYEIFFGPFLFRYVSSHFLL